VRGHSTHLDRGGRLQVWTSGTNPSTDGPYVEGKEHIAGFYIIEAGDLDAALEWGAKVTACVGAPIEVRPFAGFAGPQG